MTVEPSRDFPLNLLLEKGSYLTIITWSIKWPSRNFHTAFILKKKVIQLLLGLLNGQVVTFTLHLLLEKEKDSDLTIITWSIKWDRYG